MHSRCQQNNISLTLHADSGLSPIEMHTEGIYRCLLNLVTNAIDACLQRRETTRSSCPGEAITLSSVRIQGGVEYTVRDNCGGMDNEVKGRLFKGFFTTKGSRGTGIGLMLTRKIVDAHHGRIRVEVAQDQGCTFVIWLPQRQPEKRVDDTAKS
jgi:signal transduction histidine kinase